MLLLRLPLLFTYLLHHIHPDAHSTCQTHVSKLQEELKQSQQTNQEWQELMTGKPNWKEVFLLESSKEGNADFVKTLMKLHANISAQDSHLRTPLHLAASHGHTDVAKVLLDAGADTEIRNEHNNTPIIWAAHNGHLDIVQLLLDRGADINVCDIHKNTALHYAAMFGYLPIVKVLVEHGADLNLKNESEKTPLKVAQNKHQHKTVSWLQTQIPN